MDTLDASFSVVPHIERREVHWTVEGLFDEPTSRALQKALFKASQPLIEDSEGFRVIADMRNFAVQPREIASIIEETQVGSANLGVRKMAVLYSSMLVKQQIRRVSKTMEIEFFHDRADALEWLRAN
ncbi:STAS/SEC14 domain-containing protein [Erythrobacter sp. F6033]|uniref:STAS/SEC14 domain-containing protein n=1 Tax=Erythrobacter sp. F6033 TaxID=2926401 RepID=UPI001FF19BF8|nr:STAS/SEC14 domain-containing protein [Erythrobacter sp. F6033]MCK0127960.1 STAS/SEC14 domain-containing protein [Erythrobacter sp. F6033]